MTSRASASDAGASNDPLRLAVRPPHDLLVYRPRLGQLEPGALGLCAVPRPVPHPLPESAAPPAPVGTRPVNALPMLSRCFERQFGGLKPEERRDLFNQRARFIPTGGNDCHPIWTVHNNLTGLALVLLGVKEDVPFL
jgi:hypothetical protein